MEKTRRIAFGAAIFCGWAAAFGQPPVPLFDRVAEPLAPGAVSEQDVELAGELAYLFKLEDGTEVMRLVGGFSLRLGGTGGRGSSDAGVGRYGGGGQRLSSREGIVWMTSAAHKGRRYRRFEVYLRGNARAVGLAGTVRTGPVLLVTFASFGRVFVHADDCTGESSVQTRAYQEGAAVRDAILAGDAPPADEGTLLRIVTLQPSRAEAEAQVPTRVFFRADRTEGPDLIKGRRVVLVIGDVVAFRGKAGTDKYLQLRADAGVVFLTPPQEEAEAPGATGSLPDRAVEASTGGQAASGTQDALDAQAGFFSGAEGQVDGIYLEGDIVLSRGLHQIRASRLYYDFAADRALILDAVIRTQVPERNLPLYIRAAEIRQLSEREYAANDAILTTSEFYTPHYHIGADRIELIDRTPAEFSGERVAPRSGFFRLRGATFNVGGIPLAYWPDIRGEVSEGETSIKGLRIGFSDDYGVEFETRWQPFNLLNLETPQNFDATFRLDYFTRRGPAAGVDLEYERDRYYGMFTGYVISDEGTDNLGGRRRSIEPDTELRGRVLLRHRQLFPNDWQLTLETSYISDRTFLEEFYEGEFDRGKEQETLLYLKKQRDNWALTAHLQWRVLDFLTQTERLPDFSYRLFGQPIGDRATWYSENRAGWVRFRGREPEGLERLLGMGEDDSGTTARVDSRQEFEWPIDLGPVRLVPFASIRGSAWDDSPERGGLVRVLGTYGIRGSMYFSRVYDRIRSEFWDIDGIRHIIKPDIVAWASHSSRDSRELFIFDEDVEGIDEVDGVSIGLHQRWQTKRGGERQSSTSPVPRRIVDLLTWDVELGLFNDAESVRVTNGFTSFSRPENSISRNYLNSDLIWRINDATALVGEANIDVNDGELDVFNASLVVDRSPRLSYLFGYRFIEESNSNLLGFGANYKLSDKYAMAVREEYDVARGQTADFTIAVLRKFPRWFVILAFNLDEGEDNVGVTLSLVPEGLPRATFGSRRFTGLAESMRIQPD